MTNQQSFVGVYCLSAEHVGLILMVCSNQYK